MAYLSRKEVENRLNSIARLRLIFNTTEELNEHVGFNSGPSNSLSRIGGDNTFIKNAVYDSLCRYVKEQSGLGFDGFLTDYKTASVYFEKRRLTWLARKNSSSCYELIQYVYRGLPRKRIKDKVLASLIDEIYDPAEKKQKVNVLILILLALKLLPLYSKGRGDAADILSDYERLFTFLNPLMTDNMLFQVNQSFDVWKEQIAECPEMATRYNLYIALKEIMDNYVRCTDNRALYLSNLDFQSSVEFPMGELMWKDSGGSYWRFEALNNGYFATQYVVEPAGNRILWTRYEFFFFSDDDGLYVYIVHPQGSLKLIKGKKLTDKDTDTCIVSTSGLEGHRTVSFTPMSEKSWFKESIMTETELTYDDFLVGFRGYAFVDSNPQATYRIVSMIAAVTREHIYIPDGEGRYFRIPKSISPVLEYTSVNDNGGLFELQLTKERIIGFIDQAVYINVTSPREYEAKGITLTPTITAL